jgi:hypothetical protein
MFRQHYNSLETYTFTVVRLNSRQSSAIAEFLVCVKAGLFRQKVIHRTQLSEVNSACELLHSIDIAIQLFEI